MPRKAAAAPVTTRQLAPEPSEQDALQLLYAPVPQIDGKPPFTVSYPMISPEQADDMIRKSGMDEEMRQRSIRTSDVRRWKNLMATKRFVNFLPNGVICFDDKGVQLNG